MWKWNRKITRQLQKDLRQYSAHEGTLWFHKDAPSKTNKSSRDPRLQRLKNWISSAFGRKGLCSWMQKRAAFSDDRWLHGYLGNPRRHPAGDASVSPWNYVICWLTCVWQRPGWSRCRRISGNLISRRCHAAALMSRSGRLGAVMLSWCARIFRGVNDSANNSLIPQIFRNIVILA